MQIEGDALAGYGSSAAERESLLVEVGVWGEVKLLLVGPSSPLDRIQHLEFWLVLPIYEITSCQRKVRVPVSRYFPSLGRWHWIAWLFFPIKVGDALPVESKDTGLLRYQVRVKASQQKNKGRRAPGGIGLANICEGKAGCIS
jgi:hypothetical protein